MPAISPVVTRRRVPAPMTVAAAWAAAVNAERRWVLVGEMFNVSCCHFGSRWMTGGSNSMIGRGLVHRVLRLEGGFLNARPGG